MFERYIGSRRLPQAETNYGHRPIRGDEIDAGVDERIRRQKKKLSKSRKMKGRKQERQDGHEAYYILGKGVPPLHAVFDLLDHRCPSVKVAYLFSSNATQFKNFMATFANERGFPG